MSGYHKMWLILILLSQVLVSTLGGVGAAYYCYHNKKICPGTEVSGISLDGLDIVDAKEKLRELYSRLQLLSAGVKAILLYLLPVGHMNI